MSVETFQPRSILCQEDPQNISFRIKTREWVHGQISQEELRESYPSYLLSMSERGMRFLRRKIFGLSEKAKVVK